MNGWARAGSGKVWHQVEAARSGEGWSAGKLRVLFPCSGYLYFDPPSGVMDYRWRPFPHQQCQKKYCQQEVEA